MFGRDKNKRDADAAAEPEADGGEAVSTVEEADTAAETVSDASDLSDESVEDVEETEDVEDIADAADVAVEEIADEADEPEEPDEPADGEAEQRLIAARAELAKAEAELAKAKLAEAEADLVRAEKAAKSRQRAKAARAKTATETVGALGGSDETQQAAPAKRRRAGKTRTRPPRRMGLNAWLGVTGGMVVLVAVLATLVGVLWSKADAVASTEDGGKTAMTVATAAAQDLSSYDYRSLDSDIKTVDAESTGQWRKDYDKIMAQIKTQATTNQLVVVGTVLKAGLQSVSAKQAVAVVLLNQQTSKAGQTSSTPDQYRLELTLTKVGGDWKVSALKAL